MTTAMKMADSPMSKGTMTDLVCKCGNRITVMVNGVHNITITANANNWSVKCVSGSVPEYVCPKCRWNRP